jgi:hypothetical protein
LSAALIVIEIAAPSVSDAELAVLVSACTRAARDAECVLTKNAADEPPSAVAIVSAQAPDKMRVEVGVRDGDHDTWRTKDFSFLAADESADRWRAIGFAIGTLAESQPPPPEDSAPAPPAPVAAPQELTLPPPPPLAPKPKPGPGLQLFVGAAALFGPGLDRPPWRLGGALDALLAVPRVPLFFTAGGSAATRVTSDQSGAIVRWFDVSAGAGVPLLGPLQSSGLELSAAILGEYFDVSASTFGRSDTNSRWTLGVQGALGGRLKIVPDLFLTAEAQATGFAGRTDVRVGGNPIGSAATFRYLGSFGLRVRLR